MQSKVTPQSMVCDKLILLIIFYVQYMLSLINSQMMQTNLISELESTHKYSPSLLCALSVGGIIEYQCVCVCVCVMSAVSSEADPLLTPRQDHRQLSCCSCKLSYKPRKFSSKGAVLVLVWQLLAVSAFPKNITPVHKFTADSVDTSLGVISALILLVACVSVGLLADVQFGRFKVVKAGLLLMWAGELVLNVDNILSMTLHEKYKVVSKYSHFAGTLGTSVGAVAFFINILQFGVEQMPDSSSVGITAFISWFTIATFTGVGLHELHFRIFDHCTSKTSNHLIPLCISFTLLSVAMCSMFLFSHWLIDHRQNHNPLKTVYRVLKFAKRHKYPVQRSAFTYWEEEIPSRIDLGKTKYGGPFTTEEVEDVKTFFRIILILVSMMSFSVVGIGVFQLFPFSPVKNCNTQIRQNSTYAIPVTAFLVYELLLYPVMRCRLSMLRRIGCCVFCSVLFSLALLIFTVVSVLGPVDINEYVSTHRWTFDTFLIVFISVGYTMLTSTLEFVYSQSPELMKGFLIGSLLCILFLAAFTIGMCSKFLANPCKSNKHCTLYVASGVTVLSVAVFVFYCCVARWYKWREREEPCNERAIIEEIYGRRVEHNSIEAVDTN